MDDDLPAGKMRRARLSAASIVFLFSVISSAGIATQDRNVTLAPRSPRADADSALLAMNAAQTSSPLSRRCRIAAHIVSRSDFSVFSPFFPRFFSVGPPTKHAVGTRRFCDE